MAQRSARRQVMPKESGDGVLAYRVDSTSLEARLFVTNRKGAYVVANDRPLRTLTTTTCHAFHPRTSFHNTAQSTMIQRALTAGAVSS